MSVISWISGWIFTKLAWEYQLGKPKSWWSFYDLHLDFNFRGGLDSYNVPIVSLKNNICIVALQQVDFQQISMHLSTGPKSWWLCFDNLDTISKVTERHTHFLVCLIFLNQWAEFYQRYPLNLCADIDRIWNGMSVISNKLKSVTYLEFVTFTLRTRLSCQHCKFLWKIILLDMCWSGDLYFYKKQFWSWVDLSSLSIKCT